MSSPCLDAVKQELESASVPYRIEMGGKHIRVQYGSAYEHLHVVAATPSDWRAPLNERASIRRALREQGYVSETDEPVSAISLALHEGQPICFSYTIAENFSKAHKDVLRAIDKIRGECGEEFDRRNFTPIEYVDQKGRSHRAYRLSRDGFSLVVMGFTGHAAMEWKVKYIEAFNAMEAELRNLAVVDHTAEIAALRSDFEALSSLVLDTAGNLLNHQSTTTVIKRKLPFVRPSVIRREKRLRRAMA